MYGHVGDKEGLAVRSNVGAINDRTKGGIQSHGEVIHREGLANMVKCRDSEP